MLIFDKDYIQSLNITFLPKVDQEQPMNQVRNFYLLILAYTRMRMATMIC